MLSPLVLGGSIPDSGLFVYKAIRLLIGQEGFRDSGAYISTILGAIRPFGIPNDKFWPYTNDPVAFERMPDAWLWAFGQSFPSINQCKQDYSIDGKQNVERMKEYVGNGYALYFGLVVFSSSKCSKQWRRISIAFKWRKSRGRTLRFDRRI